MGRGRAQHHARLWFSAIARFAMSRAGVKTNLDGIERGNDGPELRVHRIDDLPRLSSAPDVRLVCHHDEKKAGVFELFASFGRVRI